MEHELGDDAKVAAATANGPEKIRVFRGAGGHLAPIGQDHLGREQIVTGQTMRGKQPANTTTQRQSCHAGVRDRAARGRQPSRAVHLASLP